MSVFMKILSALTSNVNLCSMAEQRFYDVGFARFDGDVQGRVIILQVSHFHLFRCTADDGIES
jgi:hypothetical protein